MGSAQSARMNRRGLLLGGLAAAGGTAALVAQQALAQDHSGHAMTAQAAPEADPYSAETHVGGHGDMMTVGTVDHAANGFDPSVMLTEWDTGTVSTLPTGQTLRTFE